MLRIVFGVLIVLVAFVLVNYPKSFNGMGESEILACATFAICAGMGLVASQFFKTMIRHR